LQKSLSLDELLFRLSYTTTNLSIFPRALLTITVPEVRTTGGRNNSIRNALRNTCRVCTSWHVWSGFSQCHYDSWLSTSLSKSDIQRGFPI